MIFRVLNDSSFIQFEDEAGAFLIANKWDDYAQFVTLFNLVVFDSRGTRHDVGELKIGEFGLIGDQFIASPGRRAPGIPKNFKRLDSQFFSLGQSDTYYEALNELSAATRRTILTALRDCSFDLSIFESARAEEVMNVSLLRNISEVNVRNRYHRLSHGNAELTEYNFTYTLPASSTSVLPPRLSFHVKPHSQPPTNVHVLIGRNGVGKTRSIKNFANASLSSVDQPTLYGSISIADEPGQWAFTGLVAVSFSAFDDFTVGAATRDGMRSARIGPPSGGEDLSAIETDGVLDIDEMAGSQSSFTSVFCRGLGRCRTGPRGDRLRQAISTLESDPLFAEAEIASILEDSNLNWRTDAARLFESMSSGHKIVLFTITLLVLLVEEKTIVLMDEPEGHLHPPLLSAFIRAVSDLLVSRNGVAIIATHSPVVLQEVPRSCAWVLRRGGYTCIAERPAVETFGENVGVLTREVFGLEVTNSGFHQLIKKMVSDDKSYEEVLKAFDNQLGSEARAIARSLTAIRDKAEGAS